MSREILFRGKWTDNGEWVEGSLHKEYGETRKDGSRSIDYRILGMRGECDYIIPETVGEYTGLTDKNGRKIFEGDIVSGYFDHEKIVGYIFYGSDAKFFIQRKGLFGIELNNAEDWVEVIGNIHDNPELLEVSE